MGAIRFLPCRFRGICCRESLQIHKRNFPEETISKPDMLKNHTQLTSGYRTHFKSFAIIPKLNLPERKYSASWGGIFEDIEPPASGLIALTTYCLSNIFQ